jgi:hypothetical protein
MAYKITQHRRGTYEEWLELDLVPSEGELIIVEFDNKVRKCKIGDGITSFSNLPYITDWVMSELGDRIDALQKLTGSELDAAIAELDQKIEEITSKHTRDLTVLKLDIDKQFAEVSSNINSLSDDLSKVDGVVKTLVAPAVGDLDAKYSKELSHLADQHTADKSALYQAIESNASNLSTLIERSKKQSSAETILAIENAKIELVDDYVSKIADTKEVLEHIISTTKQTIQQHDEAIEAIQDSFTELSAEVGARIDEKVATSESTNRKSIEGILESLQQLNATVELLQANHNTGTSTTLTLRNTDNEGSDLTSVLTRLEDLQYKVSELETNAGVTTTDIQAINTELLRLASTTTNLFNQQKTGFSNLTATISALETKLSKADSNLADVVAAYVNEVHNEVSRLDAADVVILQRIYKIQDDLIKKIDTVDTALQAELDEGLTKIAKSVADTKLRLDDRLTQTQTSLAESISTVNADLTKKIDNIESRHDARLGSAEVAITTLNALVQKGQVGLNNTVDNLATDVVNNTIAITNNKVAINQISSDLDNKVAIINASIETINNKVDNKTANLEDKLQTQISATDSLVQKQSETLLGIQDKVDDLANELDTRIADQILDSKAETNVSIVEIRKAISQINLTLDLLKNTSGGSVNTDTGTLTTLVSQLTELRYDVDELAKNNTTATTDLQSIKTDVIKLASSLTSIIESQKSSTDTVNKAINALDARLSKADATISTSMTTSISAINDELVDLAADDIILYQIIYRIRDELLSNINKTQIDLKAEITDKTATSGQQFKDMQEKLEEDLTNAKSDLAQSITKIETKVKDETDSLERVIFSKTAENARAISDLAAVIDAEVINVDKEVQALETDILNNKTNITSNKAAINQINTAFDSKTKLLDTDIEFLSSRLDTQEKRISSILALEDGSTTGDAELLDIRTGFDGEIHNSAGDAVRAIGNNVQSLRNSLSQFIDSQAVDGLHYDYSGEVGLMQPYMLYLKAGEDIIQDSGVQIISGSGGSGGGSAMSTLKIGYITSSPVVVTPTDKAILYFTFSGIDSSGDIILQASATWKVNGVTVAHSVVKDGENEFDVTKYIKTGTTKILLSVTDDNGSVVTKSWNVQQIELTIDSAFNDKRKYTAGETIVFDYIPSGAIDKTVVFKLDGQVIDRVQLGKEISGTTISYELPAQSHGSHLLDIYLEADINGNTVTSNHKLKDILWYDPSSTTPIIGTTVQSLTVKQYSTTNIIYTVYDPANETPTVTVKVDGKIIATAVVKPNKDYEGTTTDIYPYIATDSGTHTLELVCGDTKKTISVFVEDIGISISPVTAGLAFDFNPAGRSNSDGNPLWSYNDIHMSVSDNFDWINGGYIPNDPDGPCFCIKAGSSATIDYKLFANEAKVSGKEFKLIFKTKNVSNPDAIFLSCLDNTTDKDHVGLAMGIHAACIYGKNGNLELAYSEEDAIEFEFNISRDTETVPMVMGYEDGVPSRPMVYDSTYSFKQNTPKEITLGSPDCDLYIYRLKVYNTSLSATNILNNFIADARTSDEMISRYTRNQIYDENQKLTAEVLAEKCPWLRIYKVSAPHFTNNKSDKVSDTTIQQIHLGGDPVLDNWVVYNAQHSGQGTSSNNYGAAGRNLDFIMNKSNSYFELSDGTITDKISLTRKSIPVAYLNAKVNIASSNNLTNAIIAKRYNQFNPYTRPYVREDASIINYIKDTMEMHNCVIFIQETDPDLTTHREFADTDWHFYAIGNIGDSKKTDKTRLTDPDDPYECCVEIMDVGLPLSAFPRDTMINAMSYSVDEKTGEKNYTWAKDSNLGILHEKQEDGSYVLTSDTTVDLNKTYYVDILEHDDFSEDYTYGWRYISDDEDPEIVATCKQAWIDFYRFVTTSSDEDFKANLGNYFAIDSALYYYLFTTRYCMVDNRAKNTFWHYGKAADGTRKWDLCWDYDNDTSLGLDNYGKQVYRYGLEDIDYDGAGKEVFRQSNSLFFCRIRDLFTSELKQMYQTLESRDAWNANSFIEECDNWQSEFPEELWRLDIERKYIRTYTSSFINSKGDKQFLTNMANGRMKYHRRQWERSQEQYMASKYQTTTAMSENYHANFRVNRFESTENLAVTPNYQFTLTPYSYMYLNVQYGGTSPISVRAVPNVPTVVPYTGTDADIINVGSAASIRDFGDLSALYPDTVSVQNATRIKTLKIGNSTPGYANAGFSSLTTGSNGLLEELDITNITSFDTTLDLRALINLNKLYAFGTNIPSVIFAEGGKLSYAELPPLNSITLKNLSYLTNDGLKISDYNNIVDLIIEGCPLIDQLDLFEACPNLNTIKLDNIQFGTKTYSYFESKLFRITDASIAGTVHIESLDGKQFNEMQKRYPKLAITYDSLTSNIKFMDTDNESVIYEQNIMNAGNCSDPSSAEDWTAPIKKANQEFTYEWFGWSEVPNTLVNYETLSESDANAAEQADYAKYRVDSIKHVEGDRVLYPVFKALRNGYKVEFINPTDNNKVLYTVIVPYGKAAVYVGETPTKLDGASTDLYEFVGWYPTTEKIIGPLTCEAQFAVKDQNRLPGGEDDGDTLPGYTISWLDISNCVDYNGNPLNGNGLGYTLNASDSTMAITSSSNKFNSTVRIPETLTLSGVTYTITKLGGFRDHDNLALISLPDSLLEISAHGFYSCNALLEMLIPNSVVVIGASAFQGCTKLTELHIPRSVARIGSSAFADCTQLAKITVDPENASYNTLQNGQLLVETATGKLLQGLSGGVLTSDMGDKIRSLGEYCCSNTAITSAGIPEGITTIPTNAFSRCAALINLTLPSTLIKLDATCFAWCSNLAEVKLPDGLLDISTYVFNSCALENVEIPSSVNYVRAQSFGNIQTLKTVTFKKRINGDGTVFVPEIDVKAFSSSGTASDPIVFNVPWSEGQTPLAPWGATNAIINYDCEG